MEPLCCDPLYVAQKPSSPQGTFWPFWNKDSEWTRIISLDYFTELPIDPNSKPCLFQCHAKISAVGGSTGRRIFLPE
jgi:hypothetical protein